MKTKSVKYILIAVLLLALVAGVVIFFFMYGFYEVKNEDGTTTRIFVRKTSSLEVGDLVAYRYPLEFDTELSSRDVCVSRIVGMSGDMILIHDGDLYRNNKKVSEDYDTYMRYRASVSSGDQDLKAILSKYDVRIGYVLNDGKACEFVCTESEFRKIFDNEKDFESCRKIIDRDDWKDMDVFPSSAFFAWNKDNFGPMYLPKVGDTLKFSPQIAPMYKNIINFEGNDFQSDTYHVRINQHDAREYIATKNYCFVLNDDRTDKHDSRKYGPIPVDYIIGKVICR